MAWKSIGSTIQGWLNDAAGFASDALAQEDQSSWDRSTQYSTEMSNTAIQRRIEDARAAGFSPLAALGLGAASDAEPANAYRGSSQALIDLLMDTYGMALKAAKDGSSESRSWLSGIVGIVGQIMKLIG